MEGVFGSGQLTCTNWSFCSSSNVLSNFRSLWTSETQTSHDAAQTKRKTLTMQRKRNANQSRCSANETQTSHDAAPTKHKPVTMQRKHAREIECANCIRTCAIRSLKEVTKQCTQLASQSIQYDLIGSADRIQSDPTSNQLALVSTNAPFQYPRYGGSHEPHCTDSEAGHKVKDTELASSRIGLLCRGMGDLRVMEDGVWILSYSREWYTTDCVLTEQIHHRAGYIQLSRKQSNTHCVPDLHTESSLRCFVITSCVRPTCLRTNYDLLNAYSLPT